jgi:hypothetical protein
MRRSPPAAILCLATMPAAAAADGLPVGNVDVGRDGVTVPGAPDRIVTLESKRGGTLVLRVARDGGSVESVLRLRERVTVPGVALDGTADGRSADGRTVVLIRPRDHHEFPLKRTELVILGVKPLKVRRRVTLRGDFSFDALSPDGRRMYLVNYVDRRDPRAYVVRSFDVAAGRLERGAIVDAREPDEDMRGYPVTRETTQDGRWAYTLYDGVGEPFVHALDTEERRAFCIDLPMLAGKADPYMLRLELGGPRLSVLKGDRQVAVIDTRSMRASKPAPPRRRAEAPAADESSTDWWPAGPAAAVAAAALLGLRRGRATPRSGRRTPPGS